MADADDLEAAEPAAEQSNDDLAYWRARENEERDRAAAASCMARTAHEDLADDYADLIAQVTAQSVDGVPEPHEQDAVESEAETAEIG